jgi:NAD(P)-dependent dehydrogenase (short-subunit alcohol dehydrogenase family)
MTMSQNIAGKVVVLTGASSGLGEATARPLSAQGVVVALGVRRYIRETERHTLGQFDLLGAVFSTPGGFFQPARVA